MNAKYYKDADLLSFRVSDDQYKFARQTGDVIVHYSENKEPVLIEVVNAANILKNTSKLLPKKIRQEIASEPATSVAHRVK